MVATVILPETQAPFQNLQNIEQNITQTHCSPVDVEMSPSDLAPLSPSITVASAVASEKARLRQQSAMLDKWLSVNGNNLYPTRDEKEKLAVDMKMTYLQVNRWFANRRRKQTKRVKTANSPHSGPLPVPAAQEISLTSENEKPALKMTPEMLATLAAAIAASHSSPEADGQRHEEESEKQKEMVAQERQTITPPAIEDAQQLAAHQLSQQLSALSQYPSADPAKLLSSSSPLLLAAIYAQYGQAGLQQLLPILQAHAIQQQLQMQQVQQVMAMSRPNLVSVPEHQSSHLTTVQHTQTAPAAAPPTWMSPPVSASPIPHSDESVSDLSSTLSPRPGSPPFKDPHQLADPQLTRILNQHTQLTEKEHIAVAVLAGLCMQR